MAEMVHTIEFINYKDSLFHSVSEKSLYEGRKKFELNEQLNNLILKYKFRNYRVNFVKY